MAPNLSAPPAVLEQLWERDILPTLEDYIAIPCLSPAYQAEWARAGHIHRAAELMARWCRERPLPGVTARVLEVPGAAGGRTPALWVEVPPTPGAPEEPGVLVYGHLDKQPPLGDWGPGLGPFTPVRRGDRLYGRGAADDGYAVFAALAALEGLDRAGAPRPRVGILVEASEESGSPDLDAHLDALTKELGRPGLVVCLDSGALSYDRLWRTSSLRGCLVATVRVEVLEHGVHSGLAGGIVPSSFRILRHLLDRVEDPSDGTIRLPALLAAVPPSHVAAAADVAREVPGAAAGDLPLVPGLVPSGVSEADRLVARAWAPALEVTGMDGVPSTADGGNVLRAATAAKISVRIPPSVDARSAGAALVAALEADPPQGARVTVHLEEPAAGWVAPEPAPWVAAALDRASLGYFGRPSAAYGEGGSIPFLATLGRRFPGSQLVAIGVLGPASNAHGPDESLHLPMARAVTGAVAELVAAAGRGIGAN